MDFSLYAGPKSYAMIFFIHFIFPLIIHSPRTYAKAPKYTTMMVSRITRAFHGNIDYARREKRGGLLVGRRLIHRGIVFLLQLVQFGSHVITEGHQTLVAFLLHGTEPGTEGAFSENYRRQMSVRSCDTYHGISRKDLNSLLTRSLYRVIDEREIVEYQVLLYVRNESDELLPSANHVCSAHAHFVLILRALELTKNLAFFIDCRNLATLQYLLEIVDHRTDVVLQSLLITFQKRVLVACRSASTSGLRLCHSALVSVEGICNHQ